MVSPRAIGCDQMNLLKSHIFRRSWCIIGCTNYVSHTFTIAQKKLSISVDRVCK